QQGHPGRHRPDLQADRLQEMRGAHRTGQPGLRSPIMRSLPLLLVFLATLAQAADYPLDAPAPDGRRPGGTISQELPAPPLGNDENKDLKRERNYPEQPPTIPHAIRDYQVDKNGNKCLTCHSRASSA